MSEHSTTLDVRDMPPWERHPKIFETFDSLKSGDWKSSELAPREWVALIRKAA
jgi:uncharacterized protein (DUF2249 family)